MATDSLARAATGLHRVQRRRDRQRRRGLGQRVAAHAGAIRGPHPAADLPPHDQQPDGRSDPRVDGTAHAGAHQTSAHPFGIAMEGRAGSDGLIFVPHAASHAAHTHAHFPRGHQMAGTAAQTTCVQNCRNCKQRAIATAKHWRELARVCCIMRSALDGVTDGAVRMPHRAPGPTRTCEGHLCYHTGAHAVSRAGADPGPDCGGTNRQAERAPHRSADCAAVGAHSGPACTVADCTSQQAR